MQLKLGIIGVGHLGKFHLNNWINIKSVDIVGFYDVDDAIAEAVGKKYAIQRYNNLDALMDAVDMVDIVVPTDIHFEICQLALKKKKHIFVEKPMANTLEEGKILVDMARAANVKMQVGHIERFNPAFMAIQKDMALDPMFIEVHRLAQFNPRGTEVSVILDLMIHDLDIILTIVKSDIKNIEASGIAVLTDTPDIANVRIEFNNGCVANLTSSRISMKKMRKMRLFQKDTYISVDFLDKKTELIQLQKDAPKEDAFVFDIDTKHGKKTISIYNPNIAETNAMFTELQSFVDAVQNDTTPVVSEIDGFRAMKVAHQILEKIATNIAQ